MIRITSLFISGGGLTCACTTLDCEAERRETCEAEFFCYVETLDSVVTRGCINNKTPLLCENRKPSKLATGHYPNWPHLICCKDKPLCNQDIVPIVPTVNTGRYVIFILLRIE